MLVARILPAAAMVAAMSTPVIATAQSAADRYSLGPFDAISLRVVMWDDTDLAFETLDAIGGLYKIGPDGTIMFPIIGEMEVGGLTSQALSARVSEELQRRMGATEAPSVAVGIESFAPVYVVGDVAAPGAYTFRPGMNALQLVALAGGYFRLGEIDGGRLELDAVRMLGNLEELQISLANARIRKLRLEAEANGADSFTLPEETSYPGGREALEAIYAREREIFEALRESYASEIESLESTARLLERERETVNQKLVGIGQQIEIMQKNVGGLESLMERGLARSPTLLTAQRTLFELEARALDAENQAFRASQSLEETQRDLNDVVQRRKREILTQLQATNAEIDQLASRRETQSVLLATTGAEIATLDADSQTEFRAVYRVTRQTQDGTQSANVQPDAPIRPLDTLEVIWTRFDDDPLN